MSTISISSGLVEKKAVEKQLDNLETELDNLWIHFAQLTSMYIAGVVLVLTLSKTSELRCDVVWFLSLLVAFVALGHFVSFFRVVSHLKGSYTKLWVLEDRLKELTTGQPSSGLPKKIWPFRVYAIGALVYFIVFILFTVGVGFVPHKLPCIKPQESGKP